MPRFIILVVHFVKPAISVVCCFLVHLTLNNCYSCWIVKDSRVKELEELVSVHKAGKC